MSHGENVRQNANSRVTNRHDLEAKYGKGNVKSNTVIEKPQQSTRSHKAEDGSYEIHVSYDSYGNKAARVTYKDPKTGKPVTANVAYDGKRGQDGGLPIFDDHAKYTTKIEKPEGYQSMKHEKRVRLEMQAATHDLKAKINAGVVDKKQFTQKQKFGVKKS